MVNVIITYTLMTLGAVCAAGGLYIFIELKTFV